MAHWGPTSGAVTASASRTSWRVLHPSEALSPEVQCLNAVREYPVLDSSADWSAATAASIGSTVGAASLVSAAAGAARGRTAARATVAAVRIKVIFTGVLTTPPPVMSRTVSCRVVPDSFSWRGSRAAPRLRSLAHFGVEVGSARSRTLLREVFGWLRVVVGKVVLTLVPISHLEDHLPIMKILKICTTPLRPQKIAFCPEGLVKPSGRFRDERGVCCPDLGRRRPVGDGEDVRPGG